MRHTPSGILLLAGASNALPVPQLFPGFSLPFSLPSFPTGLPSLPTGLPSFPGGLPGLTGLPSLPTDLPSLPGGLPGLPTGLPSFPGLPTGLPGGGLSPGSGINAPTLPIPTGGDGSGVGGGDSSPGIPAPTGDVAPSAGLAERDLELPTGGGSGFDLPIPTGGSGSPLDGLRSRFSGLPRPTGGLDGLRSRFSGLPIPLPTGLPAPGNGLPGSGEGVGLPSLPSLPKPTGLPEFSLPSFPKPTGLPGFSLPSFPKPTGLPGIGKPGNGGGFSLPSLPIPTGRASEQPAAVANNDAPNDAVAPDAVAPAAAGNGSTCTSQSGLGGATENGVKDGCCTDVTVIFARGTGEPGNMGIISGPPMVKALRQKLGADKVAVQGVDYPADAMGNANMGASGGKIMASLVQTAKSKCPSTKIILSGYSQGAMVVHNALKQGVAGTDVAGAVVFGDPLAKMPITSTKVKNFCASGDFLCGGGQDLQGTHLSYGSVADQAADFIVGVVKA